MANVGSSVMFRCLWRKQATEKEGVTLKAKQDERTIASIWEKQYPFSFELFFFLIFSWWYEVVLVYFLIAKAPSERVSPVGVLYSAERESEAKTGHV